MQTKVENKVGGKNVYDMITDRIVEQLAKGIVPWHQPWVGSSALAVSWQSGKPYSMLNQLLLGKPGEWISWGEIQKRGGKVKKGSHSQMCVWTKTWTETHKNEETGEDETEEKRALKWYRVFHIDDVEGIDSKLEAVTPSKVINPIEAGESIIKGYLDRESHLKFINDIQSNSAYYSPSKDEVVVPNLDQFECPEEYYSTVFHEFVHSTMHPKRCNRVSDNKNAAFGNQVYSREELVAEIGDAMLMNRSGIEIEKTFKNSAAYIQSWLKALRNDNKMIVWAAKRGEAAAKYILNEKEEFNQSNN